MAKNLGIDFGSTYTMLSYYYEINQRVNAIQTENGSCYIPSVACLDEFGETLLMGQEARQEMIANHSLHPFRAFKMLLSEQDKNQLKAQGYDETYPPARITREFLEHFVSIAGDACDTQQFDNAVIWSQNRSLPAPTMPTITAKRTTHPIVANSSSSTTAEEPSISP